MQRASGFTLTELLASLAVGRYDLGSIISHRLRLQDGAEVEAGTDPLASDTDMDGFSDGEEVTAGTDPLDMMSYALTTPPESILLKSVYCAKNRGPCGTLDDVIAREQLHAPSLNVHGRAGRRLANQLALLAFFVGELRAQS